MAVFKKNCVILKGNENHCCGFKVLRLYELIGLKNKSKMNGKLCQIIDDYNEIEQRYPVYIFDIKRKVLIKPENLKLYTKYKSKNEINHVSSKDCKAHKMIHLSRKRPKPNVIKFLGHKILKNEISNMDSRNFVELKKMLTGNCIYIRHFFCGKNDYTIVNQLKRELLVKKKEDEKSDEMGILYIFSLFYYGL